MKQSAYTGLIAVAMDLTRIWSGAGLGTSRFSTTFHGAPAASTITPFIVIRITSACIVVLGLCAGSGSQTSPTAHTYIYITLRAGARAAASEVCSRQTLLRRPLDHAKKPLN